MNNIPDKKEIDAKLNIFYMDFILNPQIKLNKDQKAILLFYDLLIQLELDGFSGFFK